MNPFPEIRVQQFLLVLTYNVVCVLKILESSSQYEPHLLSSVQFPIEGGKVIYDLVPHDALMCPLSKVLAEESAQIFAGYTPFLKLIHEFE